MKTEFFLFGMVRAAVAGALRNKLVMEENMVVAMSLHTGKETWISQRSRQENFVPRDTDYVIFKRDYFLFELLLELG